MRLLLLLFLAPVYALASLTGTCPPSGFCNYSISETASGNLLTIDFNVNAEHPAGFTFSDTILLDLSGVSTPVVGVMDLTFFAGSVGFTDSQGTFGTAAGCGAVSSSAGPDAVPVINHCYNGGGVLFPLQAAIPINMSISAASGGGEVYFQAAFFAMNESGTRAIGVSLAPEPNPFWLCGAGLLAAGIGRRRVKRRFPLT